MTSAISCSLCGSPVAPSPSLAAPVFRHLDFHTVSRELSRCQCGECGLILNPHPYFHGAGNQDYFQSQAYGTSNQTAQIKRDHKGALVLRSAIQAELLCAELSSPPRRVLDIGCYDGALLKEIGRLAPQAELHGLEINPFVRDLFPKTQRFFFHHSLDTLEGPFDLVTTSHSIMYFENLGGLLQTVMSLLAPEGRVAVMAPDPAQNPLTLLLEDSAFYIPRCTAARLLERCGLGCRFLGDDVFQGEFFALGARGENASSLTDPEIRLDSLAKVVLDMCAAISASGCRYVLGTALNAALAHELLGDRLDAFVDENEEKVGTRFRGRPVIHPAAMPPDKALLLPYGARAAGLAAHFADKYSLACVAA